MKNILQRCCVAGCILASTTGVTYAQPHQLMPGVSMEFRLAPNSREEFTNFSFQVVNAVCVVNSGEIEETDIFVEVLRKKGKVNDMPLFSGDNVMVHVHDKESIKITAESGGRVALTNMGEYVVRAMCYAG